MKLHRLLRPVHVTHFLVLTLMLTFLSACGGGGDDSEPPVKTAPQIITGAGVKGPLVNAVVTVYVVDVTQADFKGAIVDTASTNNSAAIVGLALPLPLTPPYIMEITSTVGTTTDLTTGQFPVISTLRTLITQPLLSAGKQIYATPLTTMAVDIAMKNADSSVAPYRGNNDATVSQQELLNALPIATIQLASTLGFGVLGNVDVFDTPPLIDTTTLTTEQQTAVAQYRTAIEGLTAVVVELAQNVASPAVSADVMLNELTADLSDGVIDGMSNGSASSIIDSSVLSALSTLDISNLSIPNSDNGAGQPLSVDDIENLLVSEQSSTGSTTDTTALASIIVTPQPAQLNTDTDTDSIENAIDNCPSIANQNQRDSNNNDVGDVCDSSPVAVAESITLDEGAVISLLDGGASNVLENDTDAENDSLSAVLVSDVSNGSLTLNADGTFSYTHNGSESTNDSFTYYANDGSSRSETVTVTINITPQNDAPVALTENLTVNQGSSVNVLDSGASNLLDNDTDAESDTLTAVLDSDVSNGSLTLNANGTFSYTHNDSATTSDSFTYHARDGVANSAVVTVSINIVLRANIAPVANADSVTVDEGATVNVLDSGASSVLGNDSDADMNSLAALLDSDVSNGNLTLNADGTFSYVHNGSETTNDNFNYHARDGALNSDIVTVSISITPQNDPPLATADTNSVLEDSATNTVNGNVISNDNDADNATLTVSNAAALNNTGTYGTLSMSADGVYSYTLDNTNSSVDALDNGQTLTETFNYTVSDGNLSDTANLVITITGVTDAVAGTVDISGVWVGSTAVISDLPIGCAGLDGIPDGRTITITQTGNTLSAKTVRGVTLTGTIDTTTGVFNLQSSSFNGTDVDLAQYSDATAIINWTEDISLSGTGVSGTSLSGTINTTKVSNGSTDCTFSESISATYMYKTSGTENYSGVYALEEKQQRIFSSINGISQDPRLKPLTTELEFTSNNVIVHVAESLFSTGTATLAISNTQFDPATGFFAFNIDQTFKADTDGNPSTIEVSETTSFVFNGIFVSDPLVNSGSNGAPLVFFSTDGYLRGFSGDVDAGGTAIYAMNATSFGQGKRLTTQTKTRTRLTRKADLSGNVSRIIMGLNNPPLKRVDANSTLFMEVLDGATVLCSEAFSLGDVSLGGYSTFIKLPYREQNFSDMKFRGSTYSNIRCNTSGAASGADQVVDGNNYTVRILDSGANGINDGGTGDDVIAFSSIETASVVAPGERYTQIIDVFDISVNGVSAANPTTTGDSVVLPGYYNIHRRSPALVSWSAHPEGADFYQLRIEPTGTTDSMLIYKTQSTRITANIGGPGNKVRSLRLIAMKDSTSNGARAQAASRRLLITNGISGTFAFDLGTDIDSAYQNMQITLQGKGSISSCSVNDNVNMSCNIASSIIDFDMDIVSLNITDNTGTLVSAGTTFTLDMNFRGKGSAASVVTSPDGITGLSVSTVGAMTTAVLVQ